MAGFGKIGSNAGDSITGERIFPGERVFDTGIRNRPTSFMSKSRNRVLKEATIVWLAEQAGLRICGGDSCKCDDGDSGDAEVLDGADVSVGGGEGSVGEVKAGRKPTTKRRASGNAKSK